MVTDSQIIQNLRDKIERLQRHYDEDVNADVEDFRRTITSLASRNTQLSDEVTAYVKQIAELTGKQPDGRGWMRVSCTDYSKLLKDYEANKAELDALKAKPNDGEIKAARREIDRLDKLYKNLVDRYMERKTEVAEAQERIKLLEAKIADRTADYTSMLEERNNIKRLYDHVMSGKMDSYRDSFLTNRIAQLERQVASLADDNKEAVAMSDSTMKSLTKAYEELDNVRSYYAMRGKEIDNYKNEVRTLEKEIRRLRNWIHMRGLTGDYNADMEAEAVAKEGRIKLPVQQYFDDVKSSSPPRITEND